MKNYMAGLASLSGSYGYGRSSYKTLFYSVVLLCLAWPGGPYASSMTENRHAREQLKNTLFKMGYENIDIDGCWVSFFREIKPMETNGYTYRYTRSFNLDSFKEFSQSKITKVDLKKYNRTQYVMYVDFDDSYSANFGVRIRDFGWRINKAYPRISWPFHYHKISDYKILKKIEASLDEEFPDKKSLNRRIVYTTNGKSTGLENTFVFANDDLNLLNEFRRNVVSYAPLSRCDIEF